MWARAPTFDESVGPKSGPQAPAKCGYHERAYLLSHDIPVWVPDAVKSMATKGSFPFETAEARRLVTDDRMQTVWKKLRKRRVGGEVIDHLDWFQRLDTWGIPEAGVSLEDRCCAALFAYAAQELSSPREVWTRHDATRFAKKWDEAASLCRWISHDPMFAADREFANAAKVSAIGMEKHAELLKKEGRVVNLGQDDTPYIIGERGSGSRGDDKIRGRVRAIAIATHKLYGLFLYDIVAKLVTVAMQPQFEVTEHSVRNWCSDLVLTLPGNKASR